MLMMETTCKWMCLSEEEAKAKIAERQIETEGMVIDYKITIKETKESEYIVLTIKERLATLSEAKDALGV